jgi:hypothetical protein
MKKMEAKLKMLQELKKAMKQEGAKEMMMPEKKMGVAVEADSPENLKKGLDKAKEVIDNKDEMMEEVEAPKEEKTMEDYEKMSREELLECIKDMI